MEGGVPKTSVSWPQEPDQHFWSHPGGVLPACFVLSQDNWTPDAQCHHLEKLAHRVTLLSLEENCIFCNCTCPWDLKSRALASLVFLPSAVRSAALTIS